MITVKKLLKYKIIILLFLTGFSLRVRGQSIQFKGNMPFDSLLSAAKASDKLLFIDVCTVWCGPCREMEKDVFTDVKVGAKFNSSFINYKLDAEKGYGPWLCRRYHVISYPTYLFINEKGTLVYRANGSMPVADFLKEAANALREKKEKMTLLEMDSLYSTKKNDTAFMYAYIKRRTKLKQDNADLLNDYCALLDTASQSSLKTLQLIADNGDFMVGGLQAGRALNLLLANRKKFALLKTRQGLDTYISLAQNKTLGKAIRQKNEALLNEVLALNKGQQHDVYEEENDDMLKIRYYYGTKQYANFNQLVSKFFDAKLLKIPRDTLEKYDRAVFDQETKYVNEHYAEKSDKERQEIIDTYKHTVTIQVTTLIDKICRQILAAPVNKQMVLNGKRWMRYSTTLGAADTAYFKYVYPNSLHVYAAFLYKSGQAGDAIRVESTAVNLVTSRNLGYSDEEIAEFKQALSQMKMRKPVISYPSPGDHS